MSIARAIAATLFAYTLHLLIRAIFARATETHPYAAFEAWATVLVVACITVPVILCVKDPKPRSHEIQMGDGCPAGRAPADRDRDAVDEPGAAVRGGGGEVERDDA